jgi:hypothetical protein
VIARSTRAGAWMALLQCACGAQAGAGPAAAPLDLPGHSEATGPQPVSTPDLALRDRDTAEAYGQHVAFDGIAEGLAWPSLDRALAARHPGTGGAVTVQADRSVRVLDVLRAAWAVRDRPVLLQTPDAASVVRVAALGPKGPPAAGAKAGCHVAVFVRSDGSLRVAAPGGPREIAGEHAADVLARSLEAERATCPLRYVAFGAEADDSPWGPVFDLMIAVDRGKSAGDARYVLGQAMHPRAPAAAPAR